MQNIFIISKEISIIEILSSFLRTRTYFTQSANNLEQAAKILSEKKFDLIIMDMSARLESIDRFYQETMIAKKETPTLCLCDIPSKGNFLHGLHLNSHRFMFKPFKANELITMLHSLLGREPKKLPPKE